jgi:phage/conjugal plasmid C-4 type zinc finger TraR family protein
MPDDADLAQPREKEFLDESLERQAARAAVKETPIEIQGRRVCAGCFIPIDKKRLKANPDATRCVDCQNEKDRNGKR